MIDFPFRLVGFDLDGTLVDSSADLASAVNHVVTALGRPALSEEQVRRTIGGGAKRMLKLSLANAGIDDPEILDTRFTQLLDYYGAHIADMTRPYSGAVEALDRLNGLGVQLAVVTNKSERLAVKLLEALDMARHFTCVIGGDTLGPGRAKPAPDPILEMIERCGGVPAVFVGDSHFDIEAARAAEVPSIAVDFGFTDGVSAELGANGIINCFDDLVPALLRLRC